MARLNKGVGFASVCLGFTLLASPLAYAEDAAGTKWGAFSMTAMSITGDIIVAPNSITMSTGNVLHIEPVKSEIPHLYRFTDADKLKLIRDNTLCMPHTKNGYLVLTYPGKDQLGIDVFDGDTEPKAVKDIESLPNFCASYSYENP